LDPALAALDLRDSLVAARMLWEGADHGGASPGQAIEWSELAHDLGRARALGVRTGPGPLRRTFHRAACEDALGTPAPAAHVSALIARPGRPTVGEAVMLFADLAGPAPEPAKPAVKKPPATGAGAIAATGPRKSPADSLRRSPSHVSAHRDTSGGKTRTTTAGPATAHRDSTGGSAKPAAGTTAGSKPKASTTPAHASRAPADTTRHAAAKPAPRDSLHARPEPASPSATAADTSG
jgi:hypothetical protein